MSMIYRWILFIALFGISLSCSDHPKNSSSDMEPLDIVELRPADKWLKFPIDEDTDIRMVSDSNRKRRARIHNYQKQWNASTSVL